MIRATTVLTTDDDDRAVNTHQLVLKFLQQVRESRGYDVDCVPPERCASPFSPVRMEIELKDKAFLKEVTEATQFAIDNINDETKAKTGKTYKLKDLKKLVEARNLMFLLTFTVTEVAPDADANAVPDADEKTVQAMVFISPSGKLCNFRLEDWRVKPASEGA